MEEEEGQVGGVEETGQVEEQEGGGGRRQEDWAGNSQAEYPDDICVTWWF